MTKSGGLESYYDHELTGSQINAVKKLDDFIFSQNNCFILKGYAGTGKTYLIKGLCKYLGELPAKFNIMTPTGRAARVITGKTGYRANTIHRSIYSLDTSEINSYYSENSGRLKYFYNIKENSSVSSFYIIDEASMISDRYSETDLFRFGSGYLIKDLISFVNPFMNKIIFIGDPAQLPPVQSLFSPALSKFTLEDNFGLSIVEVEMDDVIRQDKESGILENATNIRNKINKGNFSKINLVNDNKDFSIIKQNDVLDKFIEINSDDNIDETVIIVNSNKKVQYYNELVREHYFPHNRAICPADRVILVHNAYNYEIDLFNGETADVIWVDDEIESRQIQVFIDGETRNVILAFRDVTLEFTEPDGNKKQISCKIFEPLLYKPERDIDMFEMRALYIDFKSRCRMYDPNSEPGILNIKQDEYLNCLRIKFAYSITCHKAQGGEWDVAIIDLSSAMGYRTEEWFRWAYTAITRCKSQAFIINPPLFKSKNNNSSSKVSDEIPLLKKAIKRQKNKKDPKIKIRKIAEELSGKIILRNISLPFCERYFFDDSGEWINIWYSEENKISLVDKSPDSSSEIIAEAFTRLELLTGQKI